MSAEPLPPVEVRRALAAIQKGHELGRHELTADDLDRARRILTAELNLEAARSEMRVALRRLIDDERAE